MKNFKIVIAIVALGFSILSCNEDSNFEPGVFDDTENNLIETNGICVRYQENEEELKLIVEDLLNTSDDREADFPIVDFLSLRVDINNNNLIDSNFDKSYGISNIGTNCMSFILAVDASSGCIEEEGYSYNAFFNSSNKSIDEHIIYELIINKNNVFSDSETVGLVFILRGQDSSGIIPSSTNPLLFTETIELSL